MAIVNRATAKRLHLLLGRIARGVTLFPAYLPKTAPASALMSNAAAKSARV